MVRPAIESFPDVELLLVNYLTAAPSLDVPVRTQMPLDITVTQIRVSRVAGANRTFRIDRPLVDVDVFSPDEVVATNTARQVQNLILFQLRGTTTPDGTVQHVTTVIGPHFLPDVNQEIFRRSATYELHVHA